jgi:hypothetical protein
MNYEEAWNFIFPHVSLYARALVATLWFVAALNPSIFLLVVLVVWAPVSSCWYGLQY